MVEKDTRPGQEDRRPAGQENSIGQRQGTAQTGAQNGGGENREQGEDQYTEDLRRSGDRQSSNRKDES